MVGQDIQNVTRTRINGSIYAYTGTLTKKVAWVGHESPHHVTLTAAGLIPNKHSSYRNTTQDLLDRVDQLEKDLFEKTIALAQDTAQEPEQQPVREAPSLTFRPGFGRSPFNAEQMTTMQPLGNNSTIKIDVPPVAARIAKCWFHNMF